MSNATGRRRWSAQRWKDEVFTHGLKAAKGAIITKGYPATVKAEGGKSNILTFTVSTGQLDRDKDTLAPEGWQLDEFRKNPVLAWAHDYSMLPIGRALEVGVVGGKLRSVAEFTPEDMHPFGHTVYKLYKAGYLHSVSAGFDPIEWVAAKDASRPFGIDFKRQALLEYSAVLIPSNPGALIEARSKGVAMGPMIEWAERVLDDLATAPSPARHAAVAVAKMLGTRRTYIDLAKAKDSEHVLTLDDEGEGDGSEIIDIEGIEPMTTREQAESFANRLRRGTSHPTGYDQ